MAPNLKGVGGDLVPEKHRVYGGYTPGSCASQDSQLCMLALTGDYSRYPIRTPLVPLTPIVGNFSGAKDPKRRTMKGP